MIHNRPLVAPPAEMADAGIARAMAAAPRQRKESEPAAPTPTVQVDEPAPAAALVNPLPKLFTSWTFKKTATTGKVYGKDDEESDRLSKKMASVTIEIAGSGQHLQGSIKAIQAKTEDEAHAEFLFQASQFGGQCVKSESPKTQAELDAFRAFMVDTYLVWDEQQGPQATAPTARRLPGVKL